MILIQSITRDRLIRVPVHLALLMANKAKKQAPVLEVCVDTQIINTPSVGASVLQMCESMGICCVTRDQLLHGTVTWWLVYESEQETPRLEEMDEVLAIIQTDQFVRMVNAQVKKAEGESYDHTLTQYVKQLQLIYPGKRLSVAVYGMDKYFCDQKLELKRKHREEVSGQKRKGNQKGQLAGGVKLSVSRFQVEETLVVTQLETGCCCRLTDTAQDVADLIRCYSKAVIEKPNKKDRFDCVFSFLEEGSAGVRTDKSGAGLLKVWKLQLQQLHNLGPDIAAAIVAEFPSPQALKQAYANYPDSAEAWKVTENIVVRRGAGALETGRRVGQQLSKKIHTLMTATDRGLVIK